MNPLPVADTSAFALLWQWTPALAKGFLNNISISLAAMLLACLLGLLTGIGQKAGPAWLRWACRTLTRLLCNTPWLVILFFCMMLMPYRISIAGIDILFPDWAKAVLGIALGAAANVSEIVRGALQSIPSAQWEAAEALGLSFRHRLQLVILPQCARRMLPSLMNLYALILMSTPLCSILGVSEAMAITADFLASQDRPDLLLWAYGYLLCWFLLFCYPIHRFTRLLERHLHFAS